MSSNNTQGNDNAQKKRDELYENNKKAMEERLCQPLNESQERRLSDMGQSLPFSRMFSVGSSTESGSSKNPEKK